MKMIIDSSDLEAAFEKFCDEVLDHCNTMEEVKQNRETVEGAAAMVQYILDTYIADKLRNSSVNVNTALERFKRCGERYYNEKNSD